MLKLGVGNDTFKKNIKWVKCIMIIQIVSQFNLKPLLRFEFEFSTLKSFLL